MADDPRDDLTPDQILAAQIAEREQVLAQAPAIANAARAMFDAFEAEGFTATQALYLTGIQLSQPDYDAP